MLIALAFTQAPGLLTFDTKFDLVVDPWHYLNRGAHLWDSNGAIGQLQNQAYGYLWPMGPFFALGLAAEIPAWAVQRLFMALVMCVAFLGVAKVARALGVRSDLACIVAGLAYALSPRMLTTVGTISIESWPSALAPWVLLPLVIGSTRGSPRRAAALSALAIAMVGGVNATASFGLIPVAAVWLLTRTPGPRRRQLMLWWPTLTALGTLWWLIPLVLLGQYSPPFLDFIESASVTTRVTTLFDSLRGTSHWMPYVEPRWRAGGDLISTAMLVLNSGVLLMLGIVGLAHRKVTHRLFLFSSLLLGLLLVTLGHMGAVQGWFALPLNDALDGVLAAARNVHKFDPVVRLPLVLSVALLLDTLRRSEFLASLRPGAPARPILFIGVATMTVAATIGAAMPAIQGRMAPAGLIEEVPKYWEEAGSWLDRQDHEGAALMSPGIGVAQFTWGTPNDEPLEFLVKKGRFGVRSNIPFVPPGNIRMLDAIETRLSQGQPSSGFASYLARAGIRYLVVRNDVIKAPDIPDTVLLHQALDGSPGIKRLTAFGPNLGSPAHFGSGADRNVINGGWQTNYRAIEIYEVSGGGPGAIAAEELPVVVGGPEDLLNLADARLLDEQPTVLASDADSREQPPGPVLLTDGYRDRERSFGQLHDGYSAVRLPTDPPRSGNPTRDFYLNTGDSRWRTTADVRGVKAVEASSSMADSNGFLGARPAESAIAALDGDPLTQWVSNPTADARPPMWKATFDNRPSISSVRLVGGADAPSSQTLKVTTENGTSDPIDLGPADVRTVQVPAGETNWLRIESTSRASGVSAAIAEVEIPGVRAQKTLILPTLPKAWGTPGAILLQASRDARTGCVKVSGSVRCLEGRDVAGEEDGGLHREVDLNDAATFAPSLHVRPRAGNAVERQLLDGFPVSVTSSSQAVPDTRSSAISAVDGQPGTSWIASTRDFRPRLSFRWVGKRSIRGIDVDVQPDVAARMPTRVRVSWAGGQREVDLDAEGRAEFRAILTDHVDVEVLRTHFTSSVGFDRSITPIATGITEMRLTGAPFRSLQLSQQPQTLPCGSGPVVRVNGEAMRTKITASPAQIYSGEELPAKFCGPDDQIELQEGRNDLSVESSELFAPTSLALRQGNFKAAPATPVGWSGKTVDSRSVTPPEGSRFLAFRENGNAGWEAKRAGSSLKPVRVDGWQQGWVLNPADSGLLVEKYAPERPYRVGLLVGLFGFLVLLGLVAWWTKRAPRSSAQPLTERVVRSWPAAGALMLTLGLLGGWWGVACGVAAGLLGAAMARRSPDIGAWLAGALLPCAALFYVVHPWGDDWAGLSRWPQLLCLLAVAGAGWSVVGRPRLRSRDAGNSTHR